MLNSHPEGTDTERTHEAESWFLDCCVKCKHLEEQMTLGAASWC